MRRRRRSGVFLHLTSLPGPHGIGDLGAGARAFLAFLDRADQSLWQFCPLGPTSGGVGHSPYATDSAFAGNPLLVDLRELAERGYLDERDLDGPPEAAPDAVAYDAVARFKRDRLRTAYERFRTAAGGDAAGGNDVGGDEADGDEADGDAADGDAASGDAADGNGADGGEAGGEDARDPFAAFRDREEGWLEDYALFAALKDAHDGAAWTDWPADLAGRDPDALAAARETHADAVEFHAFVQWTFDRQWRELRAAAAERGIELVGDLPLYVAADSADVWANPGAFELDGSGEPAAVAGVPPNAGDAGQRWGNPLYDWTRLRETGYGWWVARLERLLSLVDLARIDHFKGFDEFWAIPAGADEPAAGEWRPGPGADFFETVAAELDLDPGDLPFLAEDLGFIDGGVIALRERFAIPGMRVPQYADWCSEGSRDKPTNYPENAVAYTSTHDTDTAVGWYRTLPERQRDCLHYALATDGAGVNWDLIEAVWDSDAALAVTTVPDLLGLGSEARFNTPGTAEGNWRWRVAEDGLDPGVADRLAGVTVSTLR